MPTPILTEPKYTGGILHLPDALKLFPEAGHAIVNRVSTYSQAGKGMAKLQAKTAGVIADYWRVAPPLGEWSLFSPPEAPAVFQGVEQGKLSTKRDLLEKASQYCRQQEKPMILIASDLSRFIRSERYHRQKNPLARPTPEEFQLLRDRSHGIVLATLLPPWASESERHSYSTKRTGKAGRPSKMDCKLAMEVLEVLGPCWFAESGQRSYGAEHVSLGNVAKHFTKTRGIQISKAAIQRLLDSPVPNQPERRWKDFGYPYRTYRALWIQRGQPIRFE